MSERRPWDRDEQLLALHLYFCLPFGRLHQNNPDVIAVADKIGRTPSAVAMKACNFASLDPTLPQQGLGNASASDKNLWDEFMHNSESVSLEAESTFESINDDKVLNSEKLRQPIGPTETIRSVKTRRVQRFFRNSVLISYENRCAITGLSISELLIASHIIPWSADENRRADPTNGILLNALYDKAFDEGFMTFDEDLRVIFSENLKRKLKKNTDASLLFKVEGQQMIKPIRFLPDPYALKYHREQVFEKISTVVV